MEFSLQAALCQYRLKPELRTSPRRRGHGVQPSGCTVSVQAKSLNSEPHRGDAENRENGQEILGRLRRIFGIVMGIRVHGAGMEFSLQAALCQHRLKPELRTSPQRRREWLRK